MKYQVRIVPAAEREMDKPPITAHTRLSGKILSLDDNPRPRGAKKLSGREEYRLRVGDYRVLYTIDDVAFELKVEQPHDRAIRASRPYKRVGAVGWSTKLHGGR